MDNVCTFINWKVQGDVTIVPLSNGGKKVSFAASSIRPNKAGVWNKHYFVAFGQTAEYLEKCKVHSGSILTLVTEEQVYMDKNDEKQNNYLVQNFSLLSTPGSEKTKEKDNQSQQQGTPQQNAEPVPTVGDIDGLDALMAEML